MTDYSNPNRYLSYEQRVRLAQAGYVPVRAEIRRIFGKFELGMVVKDREGNTGFTELDYKPTKMCEVFALATE